MLDFNNSLVVVSLFLIPIARESRVKFLVKVTLCKRVENPDIKKCTLPPLPKTARTGIQTSLIRGVGTAYNLIVSWLQTKTVLNWDRCFFKMIVSFY